MKIKKMLSALLCVCMLCALLPVGAAAATKTVHIMGMLLNEATPYYVNGEDSTTGNPSNGIWNAWFDAANSTLHLKGLVVSTDQHKAIDVTGVTTLYIELEGANAVTTTNTDPISSGIDADTTNLVIYGTGTGSSLTVDAKAGGTGIKANSIKLQYPATLTVKGGTRAADKVVSCITSVYDAKGGDDVTTAPTDDYSHNNISTAIGYKHIVFSLKSAPGFPVYVNNTQVTSTNMGHVLSDGTVTYTPAHGSTQAKLTLNGASITSSSPRGSYTAGIYAESEPLTIHLIGTNTVGVQYSSDNTCGVYSEKALTITAKAGATLTASATYSGGGNGTTYAVYSGESITLDNCEITAGATLSSDTKNIDDNDIDNDPLRSTATIKGPYIITYDLDGGSVAGTNHAEYFASDAAFTLINPTRDGYTFAGWTGTYLTTATMPVTIPTGSTGNRSYTATWTPNAPVYYPSYYSLSFVTNGGGDMSDVTLVEYSSVDLAKYVPARESCVFTGWYADEALTTPVETVTLNKNTTVYAGWRWVDPFSDVSADDWFYGDVEWGYLNGLMRGVSEDSFAPNGTVSRAMLWQALFNLSGGVSGEGAPWYQDARKWAVENGISDGENAEAPVTREQLVEMFYRYAKWKGYDVSVGEDTNILSYDDAFDIYEEFIPAFQWACGAGLVEGDAGELAPQGEAVRAQLAAILHRFCDMSAAA